MGVVMVMVVRRMVELKEETSRYLDGEERENNNNNGGGGDTRTRRREKEGTEYTGMWSRDM